MEELATMNNQPEINDNTSFNQSLQQLRNFMSMPTSNSQANNNKRGPEKRNSSFKKQLEQNMLVFWKKRMSEIRDNPNDIRGSHKLPLARIKKVMKSDEQVKLIGADTPVVVAKACEIFIMELSQRAWIHTEQNKRKTLQRNDVANAIRDEGLLAFLKDVVPMEKAYCQADPNLLENQYPGGYAPMMNNMQSINQPEVAPEAAVVTTNNHGLTFRMNFGYDNNNGFSQ